MQVFAFASGEIVHHPNLVAAPDKRFSKVRSDESRATGDQKLRQN